MSRIRTSGIPLDEWPAPRGTIGKEIDMATETGSAGAVITRPADVGLKREVGLIGAIWASESSIIGSGWLFAALYATQAAGASAIYAWLIGGAAVLVLALVHAELGAMYPVAGGTARFPHYAFGGIAGIQFGFFAWLQAVCIAPVECYAVMHYTHYWWHSIFNPTTSVPTGLGLFLTVVLMAIFTVVNYFGIRWLARVNSAVMWWKLVIPLLAIIVLLFKWHSGNWTAGTPGPIVQGAHIDGSGGFAPFGAKGVLNAVVGAGIVFSYLGFEQADQLAGEVKNPQKTLPTAIIGAMAIGTVVYILVQVVFIVAMNPAQLVHGFPGISDANVLAGPIAGLAGLIGLGWLAFVLRLDAIVSPSGTGLIYLTATSRVTYGLARNRYVPQIFARTDKRGVPWVSLISSFVLGLVFLLPFPTWRSIVSLTTGASVLMYMSAPLSLIAFRRRLPEAPRPYRLPVAAIFCPVAFIVASLLIYWSGWEALWKLGICIVIGYVILGVAMIFDEERPRLGRKELVAASWLPVYIIGMGIISWQGQFSGGAVLAPLNTGRIHLWWDILFVAVFAVAIYIWAYFAALPRDEILAIIGEQTAATPEPEPAG
jgi:amino acid transporter